MEKTSLAYSKTLVGTYGNFKSLAYIDQLIVELELNKKSQTEIARLCYHINETYTNLLTIPELNFRRNVASLFREKYINQINKMQFVSGVFNSLLKNFAIGKLRQATKKQTND
jgi:hypothetical protein